MNHNYPCEEWLEERSCTECRQIADERSYLIEELAERNARRDRLGLPRKSFQEMFGHV